MSAIYEEIASVVYDPTASDWLRQSLHTAVRRDAVDAANDAEFLADLLKRRLDHIQRFIAVRGPEL